MSMTGAIFLSAGVPDPRRGPEYAATADTVAIQAAVSALVYVLMGRRVLVWGGQPAITPMIWVVAADMGVNYGDWVRLYQSRHFRDEFPEDSERFQNMTFCDDVDGDREKSLLAMRERMFSQHRFSAAVFIGGMGGIVDEYELFARLQPNATIVPIASTGGATLKVAELVGSIPADLSDDLDYVALFHRHLGVLVQEERYPRLKDQPDALDQRLWRSRTL
jgi:SLOG cluster3 family